MHWGLLIATCLACGCGRLGFDALGGDDTGNANGPDAGGTGTIDAPPGTSVGMIGGGGDGVADTYLRDWNSTDNFGADLELAIEGQGSQNSIVLLRFDLASIPAGATITRARVGLWTVSGEMQTTEVYEVLEAWEEGLADHQSGTSNWGNRMSGTPWMIPGVGVGSRGATQLFTMDPLANDTLYGGDVPLPIAQRWLDQPATNFGIVLRADDRDEVQFHSDESPRLDRRPHLEVWYAP